MPHRPNPANFDLPMTREEIRALQASLVQMPRFRAFKEYLEAYAKCRPEDDILPSARSMQKLVTVWKVLWKDAHKRVPLRD
jgi:hypothetical protein